MAVALGGGLGGPLKEEDPPWAWLDPLWWLEDWLPPCCPTLPLSLELALSDLAWEETVSLSRVECCHCSWLFLRTAEEIVFVGVSPRLTRLSPWNHGFTREAGADRGTGAGRFGGGTVWAGSPWVFLPLPLLLFFLATFSAEETAQDGTL